MPRRVPVPSLRPPLDLVQADRRVARQGRPRRRRGRRGRRRRGPRGASSRRGASPSSPSTARLPTDEVTSRLAGWLKDGPVQGVFWLPALDVEPAIADMDLAAFREANRRRVKNLHAAMRALYDSRGRARHVPRLGDPHGRPARPDAGGRDRAPRRGRGRLHQGLQARARRGPGEGRGLRARRARGRGGRGAAWPRPWPTRASSRSAVTTTCAGRSPSRSGRPPTDGPACR